jgi:flagellar biogenesis protein FliO
MNKKDTSILPPMGIVPPCIFEIFIFQCFRFADWKGGLSQEIQFRILWGSLAIVIFFVLYYTSLLVRVKKYYTEGNKTKQLLKISLFAILGFLSFAINFYL